MLCPGRYQSSIDLCRPAPHLTAAHPPAVGRGGCRGRQTAPLARCPAGPGASQDHAVVSRHHREKQQPSAQQQPPTRSAGYRQPKRQGRFSTGGVRRDFTGTSSVVCSGLIYSSLLIEYNKITTKMSGRKYDQKVTTCYHYYTFSLAGN